MKKSIKRYRRKQRKKIFLLHTKITQKQSENKSIATSERDLNLTKNRSPFSPRHYNCVVYIQEKTRLDKSIDCVNKLKPWKIEGKCAKCVDSVNLSEVTKARDERNT